MEKNALPQVVTLAMGGGGSSYRRLVEEVFLPAFNNSMLEQLNDSSICAVSGGQIALTTDSFVVQPLFFPGGDIGRLAVCGTVNDLAMSGARPLYLTCGMVIEAGFPLESLRRICASMAAAAKEAGVSIVTGDTKVVEKGSCDGIFINTAGVGVFDGRAPLAQRVQPGDAIIVSGTLGDHGLAILSARQGLGFQPPLATDAAPLNGLVEALLAAAPQTRALRDATRGGLAAVVNEWAASAGCEIELEEEALPVNDAVHAAAELLGFDILQIANEGKFVAAVPSEQAQAAVEALRKHHLGAHAAIIGRVGEAQRARVSLVTPYGSKRLVEMPDSEQLPRIC